MKFALVYFASSPAECKDGADVVIALDNSGSIGWFDFNQMVDFIIDLVTQLDISNPLNPSRGTQVGILTFSTDVTLQFHLNRYQSKGNLLNAINFRYTGGSTNMADAIRYGTLENPWVKISIFNSLWSSDAIGDIDFGQHFSGNGLVSDCTKPLHEPVLT